MKHLLPVLGHLTFSSQINASELLFVGSHFPAILQQQPDGSVRGVAVSLIYEIKSHSSHRYQIVEVPLKRAQILVQESAVEMLFDPYKSEPRQHYLDYTCTPFYIDQMVLYT